MMFEIVLLIPGRMYPQVVGAMLSGTFTDQSGAVISNTEVPSKTSLLESRELSWQILPD